MFTAHAVQIWPSLHAAMRRGGKKYRYPRPIRPLSNYLLVFVSESVYFKADPISTFRLSRTLSSCYPAEDSSQQIGPPALRPGKQWFGANEAVLLREWVHMGTVPIITDTLVKPWWVMTSRKLKRKRKGEKAV